MKAFLKLFQSELDRAMTVDHYLDCRGSPEKLLRQVKTSASQQKKLIKYLSTNSSNPFKLIRALSVANLLLLYSKDYFSVVQDNLKPRGGKDEWLNLKFIDPYYKFIIRCCTSQQLYVQTKTLMIRKGQAKQILFYSINMLKLLFKAVEKMPFLGRYYQQKNREVVNTAVEIIAMQAQKLYGSFKFALAQILYQREYYIRTPEDQTIMRGILCDQLTIINQEMKKLFLDKYFYPLGRGIGVKLFRPEEQSAECEKIIKAIVSNHEDTERQNKREQLQKTLFPGSGLVNWNFFEQTLLSGPLTNVTTANIYDSKFKELDDLAISEQDQESEEIQMPKLQQQISKDQQTNKSTNTGTLQLKGSEL